MGALDGRRGGICQPGEVGVSIRTALAALLTPAAAAIILVWIGAVSVWGASYDAAPGSLDAGGPSNEAWGTPAVQSPRTGADLLLSKEASPSLLRPGGMVTYTIRVTNTGPNASTAVTLIDTLPSAMSTAKGNCEGRKIKCYLGTLADGESTTLTIDVNVAHDALGSLENRAAVSSLTDDPDSANNEAVAAVIVQPPKKADLVLSKTLYGGEVFAGGTATYTLRVTNEGPNASTAVTLIDTLPSAASPAKGNCEGRKIKCYLGTLADGESTTLTIDVNVAHDALGSLENRAAVSSLTDDPDSANNEATAAVIVQPPEKADLILSKTLDGGEVFAGGTVTYTIRVTNAGPNASTAVTLIDTLPSAMSTAKGNCEGRKIKCYLGTLADGESTTLTIDVNVAHDALGSLENRAAVSSLTDDPDSANNEAVAAVIVQPPEPTPTPQPPEPTPTPVPTVIVPRAEVTPVPPIQGPGWQSVVVLVHPDRAARVTLPEHMMLLTFPKTSRARTFQIRITVYDEIPALWDPPPGLILAAVSIEAFDTQGNLLKGARLIFPANIEIALDAGQVEALGGPSQLLQTHLQGGLNLWTRSALGDPWGRVRFDLRLGAQGQATASIRLHYLGDLALAADEDRLPTAERSIGASPTPIPPAPPSVGGASIPGQLVFAPSLAGLLLVLVGSIMLGLGRAVLGRRARGGSGPL